MQLIYFSIQNLWQLNSVDFRLILCFSFFPRTNKCYNLSNVLRLSPRKTIQNTPFQQHTIFSNKEMLWGGFFCYSFSVYFFYITFFFQLKDSFLFFCQFWYFFLYIYRNMIPQNLNSLLKLVVAKRTFTVWFHV